MLQRNWSPLTKQVDRRLAPAPNEDNDKITGAVRKLGQLAEYLGAVTSEIVRIIDHQNRLSRVPFPIGPRGFLERFKRHVVEWLCLVSLVSLIHRHITNTAYLGPGRCRSTNW